jgi:pyrroloquinoline quinone (PQQ) biosynthesis protein C
MATAVSEAEASAFIAALQREVRDAEASLLDAEFLTAVESGAVNREQIGVWATAFYAATRNGRVSLGNFYANSPDDAELRRELAENIFEEETGRLSGVNKCHMDVFCDLLAAFGIDPEAADHLAPPALDSSPQGRAIGADDFYVELAAYGFSVEAPNAEFCARMARALKENYGFKDDQVSWFSMHATLDAQHGDEFRKYVSRAAQSPRGLERVRARTLTLSEITKAVWDGFGRWR